MEICSFCLTQRAFFYPSSTCRSISIDSMPHAGIFASFINIAVHSVAPRGPVLLRFVFLVNYTANIVRNQSPYFTYCEVLSSCYRTCRSAVTVLAFTNRAYAVYYTFSYDPVTVIRGKCIDDVYNPYVSGKRWLTSGTPESKVALVESS